MTGVGGKGVQIRGGGGGGGVVDRQRRGDAVCLLLAPPNDLSFLHVYHYKRSLLPVYHPQDEKFTGTMLKFFFPCVPVWSLSRLILTGVGAS